MANIKDVASKINPSYIPALGDLLLEMTSQQRQIFEQWQQSQTQLTDTLQTWIIEGSEKHDFSQSCSAAKDVTRKSGSNNLVEISPGATEEETADADSSNDSEDEERRLEVEDLEFMGQLERDGPSTQIEPPISGGPLAVLLWALDCPCSLTVDEANTHEVSKETPWLIRRSLYRFWVNQFRQRAWEKYAEASAELEHIQRLMEQYKLLENKVVFSSVKLIAMTTTGAARYSSILTEIGCETVIVEEAGEILEAHSIASLSPCCQHLVLIGDHVQLRPKVQVFKLQKEHRLDVSLFERLILNDFPRVRLNTQHRMIPEISKLMTVFYDDLQDHETTRNRQSIKGVTKNMMFIHHDKPESSQADMSKRNEYEADFALAIAYYLIQQGYPGERITILSLYLGQNEKFLSNLRINVFQISNKK
eukprot:Gregarina_sp_Poly_1__11048@NODE_886_length_5840_cov_23_566603_g633_i0_p3_GENE_NODE_886_length_5840_cov_23_566603_g633_i0NODE_886_length_5840_cov_23_566603_g633_i0_p3_ORF_typecomplete_len420_score59_20AAA_12/PF13087_6/1_1e03AAA_12/PF13087_6/3_3e23AAA_11/PF13086_6/4_7e18AAA_30/PF13604_6/0_0037Viral_helicase1/PF01443_18/0_047DUF1043/PF06295_12/0_38DUF1043/PF06295_12/9_8e02Microtub_bind/PF13931_6/0_73Microtub_bind/PF13931_6/6_1e03DUF2786/PF10979_8/11DUF2786/PF10979_8/1_7e02_NODE_886_length_5840_cov_